MKIPNRIQPLVDDGLIDDVLQRLQSPPDAPPSEPMRFALFNLALNGGSVAFVDEPVAATHRLEQLVLEVQPGLVPPVGGVVLPWPYPGEPGAATINGETAEWVNNELHVHQLPARVEIEVPGAVRRAERKGQ